MSTAPVIADQPPPVPNDRPAIADLVMADLAERKRIGIERYGVPLQAGNGRNPLVDAYQESMDQTLYLRQAIEEQHVHQPRRGSDVEAFIKAARDRYLDCDGQRTGVWHALDDLLDRYREHADTGTPLSKPVAGPHPEED